ncbi:DUF2778 domain-containing protein [Nissabacter archeti]|uniref:DUF2778 domain-containing protein n=1 Tax=Nissabacter archeti TaxID=1917880 RepID=A0ABS5JCH5_9GAMM|nr:tlde1 domain-containing protein [Nissabacter archeti]MBS0967655.1 DUF2778 domain-containing protein [Nissabacter archeti]
MTWTYHQSTGEIYHNSRYRGKGYAGRMTNKNNPDRQQVKGLGPLPRGRYKITAKTHSKGPVTLVLEQIEGTTFGRSAFRIHGERRRPPVGWASEECIILDRDIREAIWDSGDKILEVMR